MNWAVWFNSSCPKKCRTSRIFAKISISTGLGIELLRLRYLRLKSSVTSIVEPGPSEGGVTVLSTVVLTVPKSEMTEFRDKLRR